MRFLPVLALLLTACTAVAEEPAPPTPTPAPPEVPAGAEAPTPEVDALLDQIEARAAELKTYRVDKLVFKTSMLTGDEQRRLGTLAYEAGPPGKFAVHFNKLITGEGRADAMDTKYIFDGRWLLERNGFDKVAVKRQVVPPDRDPAMVDPLASGRGPFVLPLRPTKAELLRRYHVELQPVSDDDPGDSVHLRLTPRDAAAGDLRTLDLWYGRKSLLPLRARVDADDVTTIELRDAKADAELKDGTFDTTLPDDPSWKTELRPWEER